MALEVPQFSMDARSFNGSPILGNPKLCFISFIWCQKLTCKIESKHCLLQLLLSESSCVVLNYLSSTLILKLSTVVNAVILVNQTKDIWRDFTRFAIISKPNIQITQNKNFVEANHIAYHIIVNFFTKLTYSFPRKKCCFNDALLLTHAVVIKELQIIFQTSNVSICNGIIKVLSEHQPFLH